MKYLLVKDTELVKITIEEWAMPNRRFNRICFESKALVRTMDQSFEASTENLSLNGLFIRTERRLPVGNRAEVMLEIPSASSRSLFTANVRVVRNDVYGIAFQLGSLDEASFLSLQTVIKRKSRGRLKEYYPA